MLGELEELYDKERHFPEKPQNQPIPIKVSKDILDKTDDDFLYDYAEYVIQSGISLKDLNAIQRSLALSSEVLGMIGGDGFGNLLYSDTWALEEVIEGYRVVGEIYLAKILSLALSEHYYEEETKSYINSSSRRERYEEDEWYKEYYGSYEAYLENMFNDEFGKWTKGLNEVRQSLYDYVMKTDFVRNEQKEKLKLKFEQGETANWDTWYELLYRIQDSAKNTLVNYAKSHQNEYMIIEE